VIEVPASLTPLQQLDPLEIHSGIAFGPWRGPDRPEPPDERRHPRVVLEELLVDALSQPPCHVLFSGGRDSSVILALAADAARRHGLPEPIPITTRFAAFPGSWEGEWQERTIRHLGLDEWRLQDVTTEFDTLGPIATDTIRRYGVYWPSSTHNIRHSARFAGGGTLLTGGGGDELFTPWPLRKVPARQLVRRRPRRVVPRDLLIHQLPARMRRRRLLSRLRGLVLAPWLREPAQRELQARWDAVDIPLSSWKDALSYSLTTRYQELVRSAMETFAAVEGVRLVEPFYDARTVMSVANYGPPEGFRSRGRALEALFADLLPREVLYRSTKAAFNDVVFGPCAREFASTWDGTGLDDAIVDPSWLQAEWAKPRPDVRTLSCLHQAWYVANV
jgi:asparagine synthetase B (glutamine-hydrolysing)